MNFSPVVDLYYPLNQQLINRCFSGDPNVVVSYASVVVEASLECGILPCLKHFPGLGPCLVDTHHDAGIVCESFDTLSSKDLAPFRDLIEKRAPMIMVSHAAYPLITGSVSEPASLSPALIHGLLRHDLHFDGLCISDDLEMKALSNHFSIGDAAIRAIDAGNDLLLICHDILRQKEALDSLQRAFNSGTLDGQYLDTSLQRMIDCTALIRKTPATFTNPSDLPPELTGRMESHLTHAVRMIRKSDRGNLQGKNSSGEICVVLKTNAELTRHIKSSCESQTSVFAPWQKVRIFDATSETDIISFRSTNYSPVLCIGRGWRQWTELFAKSPFLLHADPLFVFLTGDPAEIDYLPETATVVSLLNETFPSIRAAFRLICENSSAPCSEW